MENKNYEYKGWCANGFVALVLILLGKAASVALIIYGANQEAPAAGWIVAAGVLLLLFFFITNTGFMLLEPNEARVLTFFGEYRGSFYKTGFWWVNFFMSKKELSLRARNLNAEPIKVNDKTGNPIMIGLVLVWRLKRDEIYTAPCLTLTLRRTLMGRCRRAPACTCWRVSLRCRATRRCVRWRDFMPTMTTEPTRVRLRCAATATR